jgi:hypothetical protein
MKNARLEARRAFFVEAKIKHSFEFREGTRCLQLLMSKVIDTLADVKIITTIHPEEFPT